MEKRILLVNPPVYDFTAYDFWVRPLGVLTAAGLFGGDCQTSLFDFLDRFYPAAGAKVKAGNDRFNRGPYPAKRIKKPEVFADIPRLYKRHGLARAVFEDFLRQNGPFDFAIVQAMMTYWYEGLEEVIKTLRKFSPNCRIILSGFYARACPGHAEKLGADHITADYDFRDLFNILQTSPGPYRPPAWGLYRQLHAGVMKLTHGCPGKCTYCAAPRMGPAFTTRPLGHATADLHKLLEIGARDIAFYDDALLHKPGLIFRPLLEYVIENGINKKVNFHTPNALHCRHLDGPTAKLMVRAGFKTFYLGVESSSDSFQRQTGGKVTHDETARAVRNLLDAGAVRQNITAYEMLGHPLGDLQRLEKSMRFVNSLGVRVMLSDFSPIPGTPDGELCRQYVDLDEPLTHNKTFFPIKLLGAEKVNYFKQLCKDLNNSLKK